jgi:amino acid adenylation domain-containing protein
MDTDRCLHELFEERSLAFADRVAITAPEGQLTYQDLNDQADAVAARLLAAGVDGSAPVALCANRSSAMIAGLLGILKTGAPYLPVDPAYPKSRIEYLLADGGVGAVLAVPGVLEALPPGPAAVVELTDAKRPAKPRLTGRGKPADPAYVIYTSGSTGQPKGVVVEHHSVTSLFAQTQPLFGFTEQDVWTLFHSISFDFSVWEIFGALLCGGRLVIVPDQVRRSPAEFVSLLAAEKVTVLNQTPSAFRQVAAAEETTGELAETALRLIVFGGERLDPAMLAGWVARHGDDKPELVNMYGITETTVHTTSRRIGKKDLGSPLSPIGKPLPETVISLRDPAGRALRAGAEGEIFVAGPGVARGYLDRPELTAQRFVTERSGDAMVRWYRSGDLAKLTPDGDLIYLGRLDDQLKVSGFRVEPGEIESCLQADDEVTAAVVTASQHGEGDVRLAAHIVPAAGGDTAGLPARLASLAERMLPAHLRPASYHLIASVPITESGKVDRAALAREAAGGEQPATPPAAGTGLTDGTRRIVFDVVTSVLGTSALAPDDDLFDHGATSLAFMRILAQLNQRFGVRITGAELDEATIGQLADLIDPQR